jgi:DNA-directed RNA polymerase subunit RPC12/RpoP
MTMKKLAMALPKPKRPPGRPKKTFDADKLESSVEVLPESPIQQLETLLIFDAKAMEVETQRELLRILPEIVQVRRMWKAHYLEYGCMSCPKADERFAIAARMRLRHYPWNEIFEIVTPNIHTRRERKCFQSSVLWKLEHPKDRAERNPNAYGSGGLCNACQIRIFMRMRNRYRKVVKGRDLAQEFATFKDALCLRYNAAQRLFNDDDCPAEPLPVKGIEAKSGAL